MTLNKRSFTPQAQLLSFSSVRHFAIRLFPYLYLVVGIIALWGGVGECRGDAPTLSPSQVPHTTHSGGPTDYGWALVKMLGGVVLVLILAVTALKLVKMLHRNTIMEQGALKFLGGMALGPRKYLVLVRVGSRLLLLGMTDHSLTHLCTIDDPEEIGRIIGTSSAQHPALASGSSPFIHIFRRMLSPKTIQNNGT